MTLMHTHTPMANCLTHIQRQRRYILSHSGFPFQIASNLRHGALCHERWQALILAAEAAAAATAASQRLQAWKWKSPKHKIHNRNAICNCGWLSSNIIFAPLTPKQLNEHNNCYNPAVMIRGFSHHSLVIRSWVEFSMYFTTRTLFA